MVAKGGKRRRGKATKREADAGTPKAKSKEGKPDGPSRKLKSKEGKPDGPSPKLKSKKGKSNGPSPTVKSKKRTSDRMPPEAQRKSRDPSAENSEAARYKQVERTLVDLWFDPICPWAWLTSRWMLEVEQVRPVKTIFHLMSLAMLDEVTVHPADDRGTTDHQGAIDDAWAPARVALAVERHYGQEQLAAFYTEIGSRFHLRQQPRTRDTIEAALSDLRLPPQMADLGYTGDNDDALRDSHHAGLDPLGDEVGTPVIHLCGAAWVGPVLTPWPTGEDAGQVFDAVRRLTSLPGFFALKRSRNTRTPS